MHTLPGSDTILSGTQGSDLEFSPVRRTGDSLHETRREFLKTASLGGGALASTMALPPVTGAAGQRDAITYAVFTKHFLGLSHDRLADTLAELGVTAIEAPIRPKGHVEPAARGR